MLRASLLRRAIARVTLVGRVGNEPELRVLKNGTKFVSLSVAVKNKHPTQATMWHKCYWFDSATREASALTKYCDAHVNKGDVVLVEGDLVQHTFMVEGQIVPPVSAPPSHEISPPAHEKRLFKVVKTQILVRTVSNFGKPTRPLDWPNVQDDDKPNE